MRPSKSITALISIFAIYFLFGCKTNYPLIRMHNIGDPDWYEADINSLIISGNSDQLCIVAKTLSYSTASAGQKFYAYRLASIAYEKDPKNQNAVLALARSAFILADSENDENLKLEFVKKGVDAVDTSSPESKDPELNYYYALNLGIIVQDKGLFGLGKLPKILNALKIASEKPEIDIGGPLRVLGMLYLKAPAWPQGIGDLDKALELLEKVSTEYPAHPQNHLFYAYALREDGDNARALEALVKAKNMAVPEIWGNYFSQKWLAEIEKLQSKVSKDLAE
jgi:hypothetical protein